MSVVTVPALTNFMHDGRPYHRGEDVTVSPLEAVTLSREGKVSLVPGYQVRALASDAPVEPPKRRRGRPRKNPDEPRTYRRRDLVPEP